MAVAVESFHPAASPLTAISNALDVAEKVYGIQGASQKAQLIRQQLQQGQTQMALAQRQNDPNSPESQFARGEMEGAIDIYSKNHPSFSGEASNLKNLIEGSKGTPDQTSQLQGPTQPGHSPLGSIITPGTPARAALSAADLAKNPEMSSLLAVIKGQQQADAFAANYKFKSDRLDNSKANTGDEAGQAFEKAPIIAASKNNLNSLTRSQSILSNTSKPVTAKDLNLAYNDYINAVAAGGAATEGKIHRELPENFDVQWNDIKGKFGQFDDLRKDPTGAQLIGMLNNNIGTVRKDLSDAAGQQALDVHDSFANNPNPYVQKTIRDKLQRYNPQAYQNLYGGGSSVASSPTPQALPIGGSTANAASPDAPPKQDPDAVTYSNMHQIPYDQAAVIIGNRKAKLGKQ